MALQAAASGTQAAPSARAGRRAGPSPGRSVRQRHGERKEQRHLRSTQHALGLSVVGQQGNAATPSDNTPTVPMYCRTSGGRSARTRQKARPDGSAEEVGLAPCAAPAPSPPVGPTPRPRRRRVRDAMAQPEQQCQHDGARHDQHPECEAIVAAYSDRTAASSSGPATAPPGPSPDAPRRRFPDRLGGGVRQERVLGGNVPPCRGARCIEQQRRGDHVAHPDQRDAEHRQCVAGDGPRQ